jgi:hypothetical protein
VCAIIRIRRTDINRSYDDLTAACPLRAPDVAPRGPEQQHPDGCGSCAVRKIVRTASRRDRDPVATARDPVATAREPAALPTFAAAEIRAVYLERSV